MARQVWRYSKGNRKSVVLFLVLFLFANIIVLLDPLVVAYMLNLIQQEGVTQDNLLSFLGFLTLFIALDISFWIFHGPARVIETKNAFLARANYKQYLLSGVMNLPPSWHTDHHSGDTIDKVDKGTRALYSFAEDSFEVIETIVRFFGAYAALVYFNVHSSYIVLLLLLLTGWLIIRFDKVLVSQYKKLNTMENDISAKIYDTISNITTVIILRIEHLVNTSIYKRIMKPWTLFQRNVTINEWKWFLVNMCGVAMLVLVIGSYVTSTVMAGGVVLMGTVYVLYGYISRVQDVFFRFAYQYGDIIRHKADVANAEKLSKEFPEALREEETHLDAGWQQLEIQQLNFSYHSKKGSDLHLDNVSFTVSHGERIAFIGESGSGKTTALKLIRGLYMPESVQIVVDGHVLPRGFQSMSGDIALIPQDPEIFNATIQDNITMGVDHSKEEIQRFTDLARFTSVVEQLPRGLKSSIVEKGVNLSGGQKQRLALARGLMASVDKSIILLDEPTSSVDPKNELSIYESIFAAFPETSIISAVHRLHLLPLFDTIMIFDNGKIVAQGSFDELLKKSNKFAADWKRYKKTIQRGG
jgi:ABC-type multidrug transport system fused ATPase/permease subunit